MDKGIVEETLITLITSFKIWTLLYGGLLLTIDTIFFTYFPVTILGTVFIAGILYKFRIPVANLEDVDGFFGQQLRPSLYLDENLMQTNQAPIEEQAGGLTVKSRLLLMKSPQMSSTPNTNGQQSNGRRVLSESPLVIIGHRAAGLDAPENSLSAIRECKKRGCTTVEFDVSLTKDNVAVLFHDDNLIRIAGVDRDINDMTWEELQRIDISVLHPLGEKFRKERVPTFEEAVNLCLSLGVKFIVDLKDDNETIANTVVKLFEKNQMYSMGTVSSFYVKAIYEVRRRDPRIIGCMAWRPAYYRFLSWSSDWKNLEPRYKSLHRDSVAIVLDCLNDWAIRNIFWWFVGLSAILFHKDAITRDETYRWTKKGIRIFVWTVNSPLEKLHFVENYQLGYLTDTLDGNEMPIIKMTKENDETDDDESSS